MALAAPMKQPGEPQTIEHFREWAAGLTLDNGEPWVLEPFQEAFIADVFAGYPECWLIVPEGNGKTTLIAGLALYHAEFTPQASIPVAASSREQAEIMYRQAEGFVLRSSRMHGLIESPIQKAKGKRKTEVPRFECLQGFRRINHYLGGRIQVFAADDRTGDGVIPTLGIIDELHRHRDMGLYRTWSGKLLKRQGQIVTISTAGEPGTEFELAREKIRQSQSAERTGSLIRAATPRIVLHDWAVREGEDPDDIPTVKRANPFSGITTDALQQKHDSETMTRQHWLRFVCNQATRDTDAAIQESEWLAAYKSGWSEGEPCWVGADIAWKWDTTAFVPLLWRGPKDRLLGPCEVITPPRDGTSTDPYLLEQAMLRIHKRNPIHTIVMDKTRAEQFASWCEGELGATVIDWPQGIPAQVEEYERFMEALRNGWLHHTGDPNLTRHALNAVARVQRLGDAVFDRPHQTRISSAQDRRVIDALKAAAMVNSAASVAPPRRPALFVGVS